MLQRAISAPASCIASITERRSAPTVIPILQASMTRCQPELSIEATILKQLTSSYVFILLASNSNGHASTTVSPAPLRPSLATCSNPIIPSFSLANPRFLSSSRISLENRPTSAWVALGPQISSNQLRPILQCLIHGAWSGIW